MVGSIPWLNRSPLESGAIASDSLLDEGLRERSKKSSIPRIRGVNMGASTSKSKYGAQDR